MFAQQLEVQDESLFPDDSRSLLKRRLGRNKAYAYVTSIENPKYVFEASCAGAPQEIHVGERFQFEVSIRGNSSLSTTTLEPEVSLDSCTVTLTAQTGGSSPSHIEVLRQKASSQRPAGPFSKDSGWKKTVDFGIFGHVLTGQDVSQSHKLCLEMQFHAANCTVVMRRESPLIVHPPPSAAASRAGSIIDEEKLLGRGGRLPSYDEAMELK